MFHHILAQQYILCLIEDDFVVNSKEIAFIFQLIGCVPMKAVTGFVKLQPLVFHFITLVFSCISRKIWNLHNVVKESENYL